MASSDSFVIYIESASLNFTVLASSSSDISSLKKKVEAQHLALSPHHGRIFVRDIKIEQSSPYINQQSQIIQLNKYYRLPDNLPLRCLFDEAKGIISLFVITRDSPVLAETCNLCQNASSDSFVIYIRSSLDFNFTFAVLASSNDDISSLKKKAAAQHLAFFPRVGRIVAKAFKIIHIPKAYYLSDNIPVRCLFDGTNKGKCVLDMDAVVVPPDSAETRTHVMYLHQNASSDSYVIYIRTESDFNFSMLASSDDNISSLKKKAEAQHLALFPQIGRIVVQAIKITHEGKEYTLPDNIPVHCLFDGATGIRILWMHVKVPPDSAKTRADVLDLCQNASSDSYVIYIRTESDFNFVMLASSDDNMSSLKKKAEAQHLALFPQIGRILAQAIKITHEGKEYFLPDNIPVCCLFDGANNKGILSLFMDEVMVPLDSAESPTHILNLCQKAGSDSFVIYIRSSSDLNFAVLTSSDDDISSLKKKAAAQHLALFPHDGRIVSQAIKIIHELNKTQGPRTYIVPDDIPVHCLFDVANKGIRLLYMDAVTVPLDLTETRTHILDLCQNGDPSSDGEMEIDASQVTVMVSDELRCCRTNGSRWHCSEKTMPNSKFCTRHFPCKSASSKRK